MYFTGAVVDTEGAHVGEDTHHRTFIGDTHTTHDLYCTVHHAPLSLGAHHLGTARFKITFLTLIEQPCGVPDMQSGGHQVHVVVGDHEANTLMLNQWLTKGDTLAHVVKRKIVRAPCLP